MSDKLPRPAQYSYTTCVLISPSGKTALDLKPFIRTLSIHESIDFVGTRATCVVHDTGLNLLESAPISGDEKVYIEWTSPEYRPGKEQRQFYGRLASITQVKPSEDGESLTYNISFIDELQYDQEFNNVGEAFSDTLSNIAEKCFKQALDNPISPITDPKHYKFNKDDTSEIVDLIIPNDAPFKGIEYCRGETFSEDKKSCLWFFFQNKDGYNFKSLETILEDQGKIYSDDEKIKSITYKFSPGDMSSTLDNREIAFNISQINQISRNTFGGLAKAGALNQSVKEVDYILKNVVETNEKFDYSKYNLFQSSLSISQDYFDTYGKESASTEYIYCDTTQTGRGNLPQSIINKKFIGSYLYTNMIQIEIPGNANLSAGMCLNLQFANIKKIDVEPGSAIPFDTSFSGQFLIKDIQHSFSQSAYLTTATVTRIGNAQ